MGYRGFASEEDYGDFKRREDREVAYEQAAERNAAEIRRFGDLLRGQPVPPAFTAVVEQNADRAHRRGDRAQAAADRRAIVDLMHAMPGVRL